MVMTSEVCYSAQQGSANIVLSWDLALTLIVRGKVNNAKTVPTSNPFCRKVRCKGSNHTHQACI